MSDKGTKMFKGLSEEICTEAWDLVVSSVSYAASVGITNKYAGCIVVLDPTNPNFTVLFTATINSAEQDAKYVEIAHSKAEVTHRTRLPSSLVQTQFPHLYQDGDTKWGGSTIEDGGLVVAFSGVQAVFDEMISEWMASAIRAICRDKMTDVMASDSSFIGR